MQHLSLKLQCQGIFNGHGSMANKPLWVLIPPFFFSEEDVPIATRQDISSFLCLLKAEGAWEGREEENETEAECV